MLGLLRKARGRLGLEMSRRHEAAILADLPETYEPAGRYVGPLRSNIRPPKIILRAGIPRVLYESGYEDNPVTAAQYGLWLHGSRDPSGARFVADWLLERQTVDGTWLYLFDHDFSGGHMTAPWISAMAQGQAMSLLERVHRTTGERRYLDAAVAALRTVPARRR